MSESGDTDPTTPKEMQQNPPGTAEGGDPDEEAGERELAGSAEGDEDRAFVEDMESDPARAGSHSPGEDLLGG